MFRETKKKEKEIIRLESRGRKRMDFPAVVLKGPIKLKYKIPKPECLQSPVCLGVKQS